MVTKQSLGSTCEMYWSRVSSHTAVAERATDVESHGWLKVHNTEPEITKKFREVYIA
jgi:hypothetical protein